MSNLNKLRVGVTGQTGFIGTHLYNYLGLQPDIERVPFDDVFFEDERRLIDFVKQCDVIVHLAAVNRHHDAQTLHDTNLKLVQKLVGALEAADSRAHVLYSSSTQEYRDNLYGRSKRAGRELLAEWAKHRNAPFTGMIIPNVFGPFGRPFYHSVISTFSYQLVNGSAPKIEIDAELALIYVNDLAAEIVHIIREHRCGDEYPIHERARYKVSQILEKLIFFQNCYLKEGVIPDFSEYFDLCLFNTFRSYLPTDYFPKAYPVHADERGKFVELVKTANGGQTSYSTTLPGVTRGNHFHIRKVERFMVLQGQAVMRLRRIGTHEVIEYGLCGDKPAYVDVPVWFVHNITNVGKHEMITAFWVNELFKADDPDTFFETV